MTELRDLVGKFMLDAVDFTTEKGKDKYHDDAQVCRFRLNGVIYMAREDPNDGYRSMLDELTVDPVRKHMDNSFPAIEVIGSYREKSGYGACEIIDLIDAVTGKVVLEIGTDNSDDYYPSFVANFQPENMVTNSG